MSITPSSPASARGDAHRTALGVVGDEVDVAIAVEIIAARSAERVVRRPVQLVGRWC